LAEALLFTAERCQHVHERVRPALDRGEIILLDRHTDSTLAYQGYGSGQDLTILRTLNALATGRITPKITFLLDLDPREAASRMTQGGRKADRFEREADDFHQRVRAGFLTLAQAEPERIKVINAAVDADSIAKQIQTYLEQLTEKSHA
jgi:dTMP kinase